MFGREEGQCVAPSSGCPIIDKAVTFTDALHKQAETAQRILDPGGDSLPVVKENPPTLRHEIALVFESSLLARTVAQSSSTTTTHGSRIETRVISVSDVLHD